MHCLQAAAAAAPQFIHAFGHPPPCSMMLIQ
jgi:hypothetical protein